MATRKKASTEKMKKSRGGIEQFTPGNISIVVIPGASVVIGSMTGKDKPSVNIELPSGS